MTKVVIKSDMTSSFGGIFPIMDVFTRKIGPTIDSTLGLRSKNQGYQYSEIFRTLMSVYLCGGSCIEDISSHLLPTLRTVPHLRVCSSDTILRAIEELQVENVAYQAESGKSYNFNTADKLNELLINVLITTRQLKKDESYDFDFDHQFLETEKYDAQMTYKKFQGYRPGVATIGNMIVGIENSDGNTNVRFHQQDTLRRTFLRLEEKGIIINRARMDCGSFSEEIVNEVKKHCKLFYIRASNCASLYNDFLKLRGWKKVEINNLEFELNSIRIRRWGFVYRLVVQRQKRMDGELELWEGEYTYRCILTNDFESTSKDIVQFYNQRGRQERIFDEMNNGFGWKHLPKSYMAQNAVFLLLTALIYNFYKYIMGKLDTKRFGLKPTSRIKAFVFKFISVPAKWIRAARQHVLNIYTSNLAYADLDFG